MKVGDELICHFIGRTFRNRVLPDLNDRVELES